MEIGGGDDSVGMGVRKLSLGADMGSGGHGHGRSGVGGGGGNVVSGGTASPR
jgi:hypothetical protein